MKVRNLAGTDSALYITAPGTKRNYAFLCDYKVTSALRLKTRIQGSTYTLAGPTTGGIALAQDIRLEQGRIAITARYALFDTDDYDNRQYIYENDVWLAYAMPVYAGKGIRNFILLEYTFSRLIRCWLRYSYTRYTDRDEIGTGLDATQGNTRNDIKLQLRIKFH
jgi:hypothetical protein